MTGFYNFIIGIGGIIIAFLAFADEIGTKINYFVNIKSLLFKIPFFIFGSLIVIVGTILKDSENETTQEAANNNYTQQLREMDNSYRTEARRTDSLTKIRIQQIIDSSYLKSIKASNETLAKYNLTLIDSLHSVATTINTKSSMAQLDIDAYNGVSPIYITDTKDGKALNVRYISANATSYNIRINTYIVEEDSSRFKSVLQYEIDPGGYSYLVPDRNRTFSFPLEQEVIQHNNLLIIFLGSYSRDEFGKNMLEFKSAYSFNFKDNKIIGVRPGIVHSNFKALLNRLNIPQL